MLHIRWAGNVHFWINFLSSSVESRWGVSEQQPADGVSLERKSRLFSEGSGSITAHGCDKMETPLRECLTSGTVYAAGLGASAILAFPQIYPSVVAAGHFGFMVELVRLAFSWSPPLDLDESASSLLGCRRMPAAGAALECRRRRSKVRATCLAVRCQLRRDL